MIRYQFLMSEKVLTPQTPSHANQNISLQSLHGLQSKAPGFEKYEFSDVSAISITQT